MLAPGLATMLVVLTTDADAARPTSSTAPCAPRPGSPSTGSTPTAACRPTTRSPCSPRAHPGIVPDARRVHRRRSPRPAVDLAAAAAGGRRGREPRHRDRGARRGRPRTTRSRSAARSPATTCSRPRSSATTPTGAGCSPRSARRSAAVRPVPRRRVDERRARLPRRAPRRARASEVDLDAAARRTCSSTCTPARHPPPSSPTTSRTTTCTRTAPTRADDDRRERDETDDPMPPRSTRRREQGAGAHRLAALAEAIPRRDDRREVRRQRDGEPRAAARVRRGHGLPALRGHQAGRRARRRPADLRDARRGSASRASSAAATA